ncbi:MAG TPA: hypothetical protein IAC73_04925 [Candidatus Limadaptatus stercoripullorum]|uniref:Uncharacterized protein n=1 Tax=Candidatus Limadaptatus stercoripullorum TaxID=2840846 RepID=A0A9D1NA86_9FIRM|nr:hypothetical protein [Candidatus Limadaptatus stercoripullorum]
MRKSKKFAAFIAAALVFAIAVPLFAACTPRTDGGEHSQHNYDPASGVWEWNDDLTEAYFVLTCLDADCGHVERMPAAVRDISGNDGPTCTEGGARRARASVILDGRGHIDEESKEMGALGHSIEDKADTGYHWRECSRCGLVENKAEHAFGPFTRDVNGHSRVCAECGYVHSGRHSNDIFDTCTICGFEGGNENGGTGDNPSKPNLAQTSTALPAVIKNIYATYKNVKIDGTAPIGIDAAIGVVVDGVTYGLFAKGNLDLTKSNAEDKTEFYIGLDKKDGARENLFSLAYDVPSIDTPYLYVGSSSAGYFKTKGLSISEMLYDSANQQYADEAAATSAEEGVDLVDTIAELAGGLLGNAIFGSTVQMNQSATGGVQYVFTLDVQYMLSTFGSQITQLLSLVKQFAGSSFDLDAYIGPVVDGIAYLLPEEDREAIVGTEMTPVTDASRKLSNLFRVLAQKMGNASDAKAYNIIIKMAFDFNPDNTFAGAVIGVDASKYVDHLNNTAASEEDKIDFDGKVQIKIDKLVISNTAVSDPFSEADAELKALIADTDAEAHNILDFDFEIAAEGDGDSGDGDSYVIKADFDLDPFVLTETVKYSDMTKGEDGNYAQSAEGQEFWKEKMAAALASMGTATVLIAKEGFTGSTFDGTVEGVDSKSVIVYAEIDSTGIDVFVWDPVNNMEVIFGDPTFPLTWSDLIDKLAQPVAGTSAENDPLALIQEIFGYVGNILPLLDLLSAEIEIDEAAGTLTLGYASVIENVVWPILDIFVTEANSGWIDANLNNLLATIFGSVTDGVADPADSVTFTLKSFNYCGTAIYPAAE